MAILNNAPWGKFRGTIGNLVVKERQGTTYMASTPASYTTPQDDKSVFIRNKLSFASKLFSAMGKIYWYKEIWKNSDIRGWNFHNKMSSVNYDLVAMDGTIDKIFLVPFEEDTNGFPIQSAAVILEADVLKVEVTFPEDIGNSYHGISCQGILYLSGCNEQRKFDFQFIPITMDDQTFLLNSTFTFNYKLSPSERLVLKHYRNRTVLLNFFLKDKNGVPLSASENVSASFVEESIIPVIQKDEKKDSNQE